jgi:predicted ATP-grasp superfamily ATP-dependent carboligase
MRVLITEAEVKQATAIAQRLGRRGVEITCLSSNPGAPAFYSKYCSERLSSPFVAHKEDYIKRLLAIVRTGKYDVVIPCSDAATTYLSELKEELSPHVAFAVAGHENLLRSLHKDRFMKFCDEKGFPIPKTFFPKTREDVLRLAGELDYPLVLKGSRGASSENVRHAGSSEELINAYDEIKDRAPAVIIQECVVGEQSCFYSVCDRGDILTAFMCKTLRSYPVTGGTPGKAMSFYDEKLVELAAKVLKELRWSGMVNIDVMKDAHSGEYKILEINPRIPGTLSLAIASGVDFPALIYDYIVEGRKEGPKSYKTGKVFRSLFKEEALYACERPSIIPRMILELFNPFITYGIDWRDPAPIIGMLKLLKWEVEDKYIKKVKR